MLMISFVGCQCNKDRADAGLPPLEEVRSAKAEDPEVLAVVDKWVNRFLVKVSHYSCSSCVDVPYK